MMRLDWMIAGIILLQILSNSAQQDAGEANCTQQQFQEIDKCNILYPSDFFNISRSPILTGERPIFADKGRLESLQKACDSFTKYYICTTTLHPLTLSCLENLIDLEKTKSFINYLCKKILPLAADKKSMLCWQSKCRLVGHERQRESNGPGACLLLDSIDTQLNCALDQTAPCVRPSQETLRGARSDTASFVAKFNCDGGTSGADADEDPEGTESPTKGGVSGGLKAQTTAPLETQSLSCSDKQNTDAGICLKELWGISKYMKDLSNGTFWLGLMGNHSAWRGMCKQTTAHQECVESKSVQDENAKSPCVFGVQIHNFATFIQILCDDDTLNKGLQQPKCVIDVTSASNCAEIADFVDGNFSLISNNNNPKAFCNLFSTPAAYFNCTMSSLKSCQGDVQKVLSSINEYGAIMGCLARVSTEPTAPPKTLASNSEPQTVAKGVSCSEKLAAQCHEISLNPITIAQNLDKVDATFCSNYSKKLDECTTCKMINYTFSLSSLYAFVCGPGFENFVALKPCLKSVSEEPANKSCLSNFFNDFSAENACSTVKSMLNCSYPQVAKKCGEIGQEFHLNILHNLAVNLNPSCILPKPATSDSAVEQSSDSILGFNNCTDGDKKKLDQCQKPFRKLLQDLEGSSKGGLGAIVGALKNVSTVVKQGCMLRENFYHCVKQNINPESLCSIDSCMIKIGETACSDNVTGKEIEGRVRCMFSLVTDPKFQQCTKVFPKDVFSSLSKLKLYIPQFLECLKDSVLKKCGEQSWRLAKSFASNKSDSTCTLDFKNSSLWFPTPGASTPEPESEPSTTDSTDLRPPSLEPQPIDSSNGSIASVDNLFDHSPPLCTTEALDQHEDCSNVLGDQKPMPIVIFDDPAKLDQACRLFSNYKTCLTKYNCFYPLAEAYKSILYNVCTTYYDSYKVNANCLKRAASNSKAAGCIRKFQSTDLRSASPNLSGLGCQSISDLLKCVGDTVDLSCGTQGLDLLYNLYRPASRKFLSTCSPNRTEIGPPMKECTRDQRNLYFPCRAMVPINPISVVNSSLEFNETCRVFGDTFQSCVQKAPCLPQPAHQAFNDTLSFLCDAESNRQDFEQFGPCLVQLASSESVRPCAKMFEQITWDDPGKMVCRKLNQVMDCIYPLINARCQADTLIFTYQIFSTMARGYRTGCLLNVPPHVQVTGKPAQNTGPPPQFVQKMDTTFSPPLSTTKGCAQISASYAAFIFGSILMLFPRAL